MQKEREAYEVVVEGGKLLYRQNQTLVNTVEGSKWIFVLSTSRKLYVGQVSAARRLVLTQFSDQLPSSLFLSLAKNSGLFVSLLCVCTNFFVVAEDEG